jgi:hypothetical protein
MARLSNPHYYTPENPTILTGNAYQTGYLFKQIKMDIEARCVF